MMKITGLSHLFKWENLHNWRLTKYFFAPLYMNINIYTCKHFQNIYCMCVLLYIHNKYTLYTHIYYLNKNFYFWMRLIV